MFTKPNQTADLTRQPSTCRRQARWVTLVLLTSALLLASARGQDAPAAGQADQDGSTAAPASATEALVAADPCEPADPCEAPLPAVVDPNLLEDAPDLSLDPCAALPPPIMPGKPYWSQAVHPQITAHVYRLIDYPYYPGGAPLIEPQAVRARPLAQMEPEVADPCELPPADLVDAQSTAADAEPDPCDRDAEMDDPCHTITTRWLFDPNEAQANWDHCGPALIRCFDLVYQWRRLNEQPALAREIIYACELTRMDTDIYRLEPTQAVAVRRTVGHIAQVNRKFDRTARQVMMAALSNGPVKVLLSRLEKQLSDLHALYERLADQNDAIAETLGVGSLPHGPPVYPPDLIDFTHLAQPVPY